MRITSLLLAIPLLVGSPSWVINEAALSGHVTDSSLRPLAGVCVTIGAPIRCATVTALDGSYFVSLDGSPPGVRYDIAFLVDGVRKAARPGMQVLPPLVLDVQIGTDLGGFIPPPAPTAPPPVTAVPLPAPSSAPAATPTATPAPVIGVPYVSAPPDAPAPRVLLALSSTRSVVPGTQFIFVFDQPMLRSGRSGRIIRIQDVRGVVLDLVDGFSWSDDGTALTWSGEPRLVGGSGPLSLPARVVDSQGFAAETGRGWDITVSVSIP